MPTQKIATHTIFRKAAQKRVFSNVTEFSFFEIRGTVSRGKYFWCLKKCNPYFLSVY